MTLTNVFSSYHHQLKRYAKLAERVMQRTQDFQKLTLADFPQETAKLKKRLAQGETEDDILLDAYALVGAASTKVLGMTPYKVQIIGGIILNHNMIAEMHTGEGKTLTATMPLYLNALSGKGSHLITANPYLAKRDAEELKPLYNALGLTVGITNEEDNDIVSKKKAYGADITYTTGAAIGFDYLNDNLAKSDVEMRQRGFNYVLLDEADSILLDNANTPLIISGAGIPLGHQYQKADAFVRYQLSEDSVIVERDKHSVRLKPSGIMAAKRVYGDDLFENQRANVHYLMNALQAYYLYDKGHEYLTRDSKKEGIRTVELVDANTGRVLEGQRFSEGIHQALEAKENVLIHSPNMTSASITYQSLFSMYNKVAGMTGTAMTDREELDSIYGLKVIPVPPNKKDRRVDYPDKIYVNEKEKYKAVAEQIVKYSDRKQPVLVGTTSVVDSEKLSKLLDRYGIPHQTLNANNPQYEAQIVAQAGKKGAVTIATNMAGRGTDIKLDKGVAELGGLVVIGTQRHNSPRIDNQLRGRAARQGQPGITQFFVSLDDDIFKNFKPNALAHYRKRYHNVKGAIRNRHLDNLFNQAQKELATQSYENRKSDLTYESIIANERETIYQQRKVFINRQYDPKKFMQQTVDSVINNYFNHLNKKAHPTRQLIRKIQKDFINTFLSSSLITLGSSSLYHHVSDIQHKIHKVAYAELDARAKVLGNGFIDIVNQTALQVIDFYWSKEIAYLNDLKRMITLEGYRQANPYVEYQRRASISYSEMLIKIRQVIIQIFYQTQFNIINRPQSGDIVQATLPDNQDNKEGINQNGK